MKLVYRFTLSDEEFGRAWLREYYRRPGWRVTRVLGGPLVIGLGVFMVRSADLFTRAIGVAAMVLGLWYGLKPLLAAHLMKRRRRESGRSEVELEVTLSDQGLRIDDGKVRTELGWDEVRSAGRGDGYVWYELRGGSRATIPSRAVDDREALERMLREHTEWVG